MASPRSASSAPVKRKFDTTALITTASWGIGAAAALFLAVLASLSDYGARRITAAVSGPSGSAHMANNAAKPEDSATMPAQKSAALSMPAAKPVAVTHVRLPPRPESQQLAQIQPPPDLPKVVPKPEPSVETQKLQDQIKLLMADRDRLAQRLGALERSLEDVTGSIRRQESEFKREPAARLPAPAPLGPVSTVSWPAIITAVSTSAPSSDPAMEDVPEVTASIPPKTPMPQSRPEETEAAEAKPETDTAAVEPAEPPGKDEATAPQAAAPAKRITHGIDLGGADSVAQLRILWRGLRANEAMLLRGLRPVAFMSGTRRGRPDVRLIAGPIADARETAKICSALLTAGRYCEPAVYTGHRLSSR